MKIAAAVVIDAWKLPVFERHLRESGHAWTQHPGITPDTLTLKVDAESIRVLEPVVRAANTECAQLAGMN